MTNMLDIVDALVDTGGMGTAAAVAEMTYSPVFLAQDARAVANMLALGVQAGEPVDLTDRPGSHMMCRFHLVHTATGEEEDGGSAAMLHGYLTDGTYPGVPGDYTLVPVLGRATLDGAGLESTGTESTGA